MFFYKAKRARAQLDAFQLAVIVFTIVLCHRCRRRRPLCLSSLLSFAQSNRCNSSRIIAVIKLQVSQDMIQF